MIQDQLVEYITSQLKAGVAAETIKATLVAAGWQSADVDDTLKKVQPPAVSPQPAVATSTVSSVSAMGVGTTTTTTTTTGPKPISTARVEPQTIRVSDLVSTSDKAVSISAAKPIDTRAESTKKFLTPTVSPTATSYQAPTVKSSSSFGPITTEIILGFLMVVFGVAAAYFLFENQSLSGQVSSLTAESTSIAAKVSTLQGQLDASTTALTAQVASTTLESQELALNLSFYVTPLDATTTPTSTTVLTGFVSGSSKAYTITTPYGAKVSVTNSKDPRVSILMQPLVGTTTAQFAGTYTPGIDAITLTTINGVSLAVPAVAPAATSSATSSAAASAPMIPAPASSSTGSSTAK